MEQMCGSLAVGQCKLTKSVWYKAASKNFQENSDLGKYELKG